MLILDRGLAPFTVEQRRDMLELLDDRYGQRSTLVTSQMSGGQLAATVR